MKRPSSFKAEHIQPRRSPHALEHDIARPLAGDEATRDLSLRITREGEVPHACLIGGERIGLEWPDRKSVV